MGNAMQDRAEAAKLPDGDVIKVLLEQHAQIHELFDQVMSSAGEQKKQSFDALRALLAVHETAEEMVLRPISSKVAGEDVAQARNDEEKEANEVLAALEKLDVDSPDFSEKFAEFQKSVDQHAEAEEHGEFPAILDQCSEDERQSMGKKIKAAEGIAPTHPHPSAAGSTTAQMVLGPFASIVDRAKDAISKAS